jgi:hypothetical protein
MHTSGFTSSSDFPIVEAVSKFYNGGSEDAFVTKLSPTERPTCTRLISGAEAPRKPFAW